MAAAPRGGRCGKRRRPAGAEARAHPRLGRLPGWAWMRSRASSAVGRRLMHEDGRPTGKLANEIAVELVP